MFYNPLFDLNKNGCIDAVEFSFMDSFLNCNDDEERELDEVSKGLEKADLDYDFRNDGFW